MSHASHGITLDDAPEIVAAAPFAASRFVKFTLGIVALFGFGVFVTSIPSDPLHAWSCFHVNTLFWYLLAVAASGFAAVLHICNGQWARSLRRLYEAPSQYLFVGLYPLTLLYLLGWDYLFGWMHNPEPGRGIWFDPQMVFIRDAAALLLIAVLIRRFVRLSLRQDVGAIRRGLTGVDRSLLDRWFDRTYDGCTAGWGDDSRAEIAKSERRKGILSPLIVIVVSLAGSLVAFDQLMSIDQRWYSTLFGAFVIMSSVYAAMAWISIGVLIAQAGHKIFRAKISGDTLHDQGKLLFGFGIFWAYLMWSHYLTIWYGNLPEETGWIITRLRLEPWHSLSWGVLGLCFIFPFFFGLSRDVKRVPVLLAAASAAVLVGLWLQTAVIVLPTLYPHEIPLGAMDVSITAAFASVFLLCTLRFLERVPLIPFGDLYAKK